MTLEEFVDALMALEQGEPVTVSDWAKERHAWQLRLEVDRDLRNQFRALYATKRSGEPPSEPTEIPQSSGAAEPLDIELEPLPHIERALASYQRVANVAPTAQLVLVAPENELDQTLPPIPVAPAKLPFRAGPAVPPPAAPVEPHPDAGATAALPADDDIKGVVEATRRIHDMTVEEYAELRASLKIAGEEEDPEAATRRVWARAKIATTRGQELLRRVFFERFQKSDEDRVAFEEELKEQLARAGRKSETP